MQHLNRVVCRTADDEFVCSLIVDDGLYVVRTGNVGGLLTDMSGKTVNTVESIGDTQSFVEEIIINEERLKDATGASLRNMPNTLYVDFSDIRSAETREEESEGSGTLNAMIVETGRGRLHFIFSFAREEEIEALRAQLQQDAGANRAND